MKRGPNNRKMKRPLSSSIGKYNNNKVNRKNSQFLKDTNRTSNSYNPLDKKSTSSNFSTRTQSLNQFINNNNNSGYNKNLADILNEIINSKLYGNNKDDGFDKILNQKQYSSLHRKISPSPSLTDLLRNMKNKYSNKYINTLSYRLKNNLSCGNNKNVNSLEKMIDILRDYEKEKYEQKKNEKIKRKEEINDNIDKLTIFLKNYKIDKKKNEYEKFKLEKQINTLLYVREKYSGSRKELENIAYEIEETGKQIKQLNEETNEIKKYCLEEENIVLRLKKDIGITNKAISYIKKEIDTIIPGINYLNKHINEMKTKISSQEHFNSIFFLNMLSMIENFNYE